MADMDDAQFQGSLNAEQKTYLDGLLKKTGETAVTTFKTEADDARKKSIPEKYELKLTDGSALDPKGDVEKIVAYAKAQGLSNEQAQALLNHQHEVATGLVSRQQQAFTEQSETWATQTWADKDLGGEHKDVTLKNVKRVMDKFAPEGSKIRTVLNESGYGNHPEWVRFINAIGKAMAEDRPLTIATGVAGDDGTNDGTKKTQAQRMFPDLPSTNQ